MSPEYNNIRYNTKVVVVVNRLDFKLPSVTLSNRDLINKRAKRDAVRNAR